MCGRRTWRASSRALDPDATEATLHNSEAGSLALAARNCTLRSSQVNNAVTKAAIALMRIVAHQFERFPALIAAIAQVAAVNRNHLALGN